MKINPNIEKVTTSADSSRVCGPDKIYFYFNRFSIYISAQDESHHVRITCRILRDQPEIIFFKIINLSHRFSPQQVYIDVVNSNMLDFSTSEQYSDRYSHFTVGFELFSKFCRALGLSYGCPVCTLTA